MHGCVISALEVTHLLQHLSCGSCGLTNDKLHMMDGEMLSVHTWAAQVHTADGAWAVQDRMRYLHGHGSGGEGKAPAQHYSHGA